MGGIRLGGPSHTQMELLGKRTPVELRGEGRVGDTGMETAREARAPALSWGRVDTEKRRRTEWLGPPVFGNSAGEGKYQ